jgi:glutathione S-transferase
VITLYGVELSTFTRKVRLALAEKGLEYRLEVTAMGSPRVRALNPLGKIPVLEHEGTVIPDSSVIVAWLERVFPDRPLWPSEPRALARALWLEEYADTRLREVTVPFFAERVVKPLFQGRDGDEEALGRVAAARDETFDYLERELGEAAFFAGGSLTIADVAVGAQLVTYGQGEGPIPPDRWPSLARCLARLVTRPAWAPILSAEERTLESARQKKRPAG